jgi:hypothetical protein
LGASVCARSPKGRIPKAQKTSDTLELRHFFTDPKTCKTTEKIDANRYFAAIAAPRSKLRFRPVDIIRIDPAFLGLIFVGVFCAFCKIALFVLFSALFKMRN